MATPVLRASVEPPVAPLAMPKQILTPEQGLMRRAVAALAARVTLMRPGLRRAD